MAGHRFVGGDAGRRQRFFRRHRRAVSMGQGAPAMIPWNSASPRWEKRCPIPRFRLSIPRPARLFPWANRANSAPAATWSMKGYDDDPAATAETVDAHGWLQGAAVVLVAAASVARMSLTVWSDWAGEKRNTRSTVCSAVACPNAAKAKSMAAAKRMTFAPMAFIVDELSWNRQPRLASPGGFEPPLPP